MKKYTVKVTTQAQEQILAYAKYIGNNLQNPLAAKHFINGIQKEIKDLNTMPKKFPLLDKEPWKTVGIHKLVYKGYLIYYLIEDDKSEVYVVGVVLSRRNQIKQLEQLNEQLNLK